MTHPIYYINYIRPNKALNAAEKVVIMQVEKQKWLTIQDNADLERFEAYLVDVAEFAQKSCPRSRGFVIDKEIIMDGTRRFEIKSNTKNAHTVIVVYVSYIRGEWKGGRL